MPDDPILAAKVKALSKYQSDTPFYQLPGYDGADGRVLPVTNIQLLSTTQTSGGTAVAITWVKPDDPNVAKFEVWVQGSILGSNQPYLAASVADAPAIFTVSSDIATTGVAFIRTVMKNGLGTDLTAAPSVAFGTSLTNPSNVGIQVVGLTLTNNSPGAGNLAWSACTVYYNGTAYSIAAGNTGATGDQQIYWTVGNGTFSHANRFAPTINVFGIATNVFGVGDTTWNKIGSLGVQGQHLYPVLTFDGRNGSLVISNVTFSDNSPTATNVAWSACQATYQGVTYSIPSGSSGLYVVWRLATPNQFSSVGGSLVLGPDDFLIGSARFHGSPGTKGFFARAFTEASNTGSFTVLDETGITGFNQAGNITFQLQRQLDDLSGTYNATGLMTIQDGNNNQLVGVTSKVNGGGNQVGFIQQRAFTLANTPNGQIVGDRAVIIDSIANPTYSALATGGGTLVTPIYWDGANWRNG